MEAEYIEDEEIISTVNQKEKDRLLTKSAPFGAPGEYTMLS